MDLEYNTRVHTETGEAPKDRWRKLAKVRWAEEEKLRRAFLWRETRTPDKSGVFGLFGTEFQVGPSLARKKIEVRYDPEQLEQIEVWHDKKFAERLTPFVVGTHRRPKAPDPEPSPPPAPAADWLGHLVKKRRKEGFIVPVPQVDPDDALVVLLAARLDPAVLDVASIRAFLHRFGPFDLAAATSVLDRLLAQGPNDHHVHVYLEAIRREIKGEST